MLKFLLGFICWLVYISMQMWALLFLLGMVWSAHWLTLVNLLINTLLPVLPHEIDIIWKERVFVMYTTVLSDVWRLRSFSNVWQSWRRVRKCYVDIKTGANIKVRTEGISTHGQLPEGMVYCNWFVCYFKDLKLK